MKCIETGAYTKEFGPLIDIELFYEEHVCAERSYLPPWELLNEKQQTRVAKQAQRVYNGINALAGSIYTDRRIKRSNKC
jgi:hypothetical protein